MLINETKNLRLISDYKNINKYRSSFNELAGEVFEIDFEPWYKAGFWNERYVCYSYAAGDVVVSNISVNKMDLIINGETKSAIQIGTVMTRSDYRKKGLSSDLMNIVLNEYTSKCDFIYLFANESAYGFYPGFGFKELGETSFAFKPEFSGMKGPAIRRLDINNNKDYEILKRLSFKSAPVSKKFGVMNYSHLIMFYCLSYYADAIYYIDDIDAVVIYRIENGSLYLYDILCGNGADLEIIINALSEDMRKTAAQKIVFMFTPDRFGQNISGSREEKDYKLFVRSAAGEFPDEFIVPRLSHA